MRLEWQATRELRARNISVALAVEVKGHLASDAARATQYLDRARQTLDPAFWEEEDKPGTEDEDPRRMDDDRQGRGQDPGRLRT